MPGEFSPVGRRAYAGEPFPLPLLEGEEVVHAINPDTRRVSRYQALFANLIGLLAVTSWLPAIPVAIMAEHDMIQGFWHGALLYGEFLLASMVVYWLLTAPFIFLSASKYRYWVTNRRVVTRSGVIGYKISSIPLERISDVTVSHNVVAMISRTPVLVIRDMAANAHWRGAQWIGVDDAEHVQHSILTEVAAVNSRRSGV